MIRFGFFLVFAWTCLTGVVVQAQLVVTTTADEDDGNALPGNGTGTSLREAVKYASTNATITFTNALSGQTISVTNGHIAISKNVTIDASALPDGVIINGHSVNRLFRPVSQTTNALIGLTLTGGFTAQGGGAILNDSVLTIERCVIRENTANEAGAIFNFGTLTVNNSTIVGNRARFAGAIEQDGFTGPVTLNHCTLTGNVATNDSGAILNFFDLTLNHCTIVGNQASYGGGINDEGTMYLTNCIIAGNVATNNPSTGQIAGSIDGAGGINIISTNAMVSPLGDYGGPTPTMPPLPGSPAIDPVGGHTNSVFATDQRGLPRVVNGIVDVGAVEVQSTHAGPVHISGAAMLGDGTFQLSFNSVPGASFTVLASTNVVLPTSHWPEVGPAAEMPPGSGQFQFTDPGATNHPQRYYRVRSQ